RPHIGDEGVTRAIFARQVSFVLGDVGVLGAQFRDHFRGNGRIDAAGVAAGFGDVLDLLILGPRLRGLHARGDQLFFEVGELLVVESYALGHHQIVGRAIVLDRLFGGDDLRLQLADLAVEPGRSNARGVIFGAN